ncbi:hypothetical protein D3C80_1452160 [compost metagenome]
MVDLSALAASAVVMLVAKLGSLPSASASSLSVSSAAGAEPISVWIRASICAGVSVSTLFALSSSPGTVTISVTLPEPSKPTSPVASPPSVSSRATLSFEAVAALAPRVRSGSSRSVRV